MKYKLSDLFELQMGKTPDRSQKKYWDNGIKDWISIADISGCDKYICNTKEKISVVAEKETGIKIIPKNTVIMSFKLSIGKVAITSKGMYSNEAIMAFIDKKVEEIDKEYLYYMFSGMNWDTGTNKAVMGKTLNKATLSQQKIKLHSAIEQAKIVKNLKVLTDVINMRRQQLLALNNLIKSRFVEMFGDPVSNPKRWRMLLLENLGELNRGISKHRPRNAPELLGGNYPLIQTGEVANSDTYIKEYISTYSEMGFKQSRMWSKGTLCITIAANIAKTAILDFDACFPDSIVGFVPNKKANQLFIHYWFSFFQEMLEAQAPESAQKNINLQILRGLKVIAPPIELQNQFADFVQQVDKSKVAIQRSLDETQELFDCLMQKYFG